MANDKMKQVLEYIVLYPGEQQPDVDAVISSMSRNTILNMILVLTNLYSNKDLNNLSLFFSDKETLHDVIRRILRYCNPQADYYSSTANCIENAANGVCYASNANGSTIR